MKGKPSESRCPTIPKYGKISNKMLEIVFDCQVKGENVKKLGKLLKAEVIDKRSLWSLQAKLRS